MNEPAKPPRPRPVPVPDPETAPYWEGADEGRLLVQRCTRHGHHQLYPRPHCVVCRGPVEWREASGRATVYSFTVIRQNMARPFRDLIPYVVAGAGAVTVHPIGSGTSWSKPAGNVGAGVEYRFDRFGVRAEARDVMYKFDRFGYDHTQNQVAWQGGVTLSF